MLQLRAKPRIDARFRTCSHTRYRRWSLRQVPLFFYVWSIAFLLGWLLVYNAASLLAASAPSVLSQNGNIPPNCVELISNGGFETISQSWVIASSVRPAEYTNTVVHGGQRAMRLGIVDLPNIESESAASQTVTLPGNASSIVLSFYHYPLYDDAPGPGDLQFVDIFNAFSNQFVGRALSEQSNARQWLFKQYDLTVLAGQQVRVVLAVSNDGTNGRTAMYVDDVSILACGATVTPTDMFTETPTTGATATVTPLTLTPVDTPTPITVTPIPPTATPPVPTPTMPAGFMCPNGAAPIDLIVDGGFEGGSSWIFGEDPVPPRYTSEQVFSGGRAVLLGNPPDPGTANQVTYSSIRQFVTIPHEAISAQLRWQRLPRSQEPPSDAPGRWQDRQDVIVLSPELQTIDIMRRERRNDAGWSEGAYDFPIDFFRGKSIYIYFNAFNDGNGARTWMFLDDVRLLVCLAAAVAQPPAPIMPTTYVAPDAADGMQAEPGSIIVLTAAVVPAPVQEPINTVIPPSLLLASPTPPGTATPTLLPITVPPATSTPDTAAPSLRIITPSLTPRALIPLVTSLPPSTPLSVPQGTAALATYTTSSTAGVATTPTAPSGASSSISSDAVTTAETSLFDRVGTVAVLVFIVATVGLLSLGIGQVVRANGKSQQQ